jgi:hypothetical protein
MRTYSVLYAQDVPHYGTSEIEADNDDEAIEKAKAISDDDLTVLTLDPAWDSAVCTRIVHIEAPDGNLIAADVPLDAYTLIYGEDKRLLSDASDQMHLVRARAAKYFADDGTEHHPLAGEIDAVICRARGQQ